MGEIAGSAADNWFGYSVDINDDGNVAIIGARYNDDNGDRSGQVKIFEYTNGAWYQKGQSLSGDTSHDQFGYSVAISGDGKRAIGGAPYNDANGNAAGHVQIFDRQWKFTLSLCRIKEFQILSI